jgi:chemotaxis protein MotB
MHPSITPVKNLLPGKRKPHHGKWIGRLLVSAILIAAMIGPIGCVSTATHEQVRKERDRLLAENEEIEGRYDLLKRRIAQIDNERLAQGAVIQIQQSMITAKAAVIQQQKKKLQRQERVIVDQSEMIDSQAKALELVQRTYNTLSGVFAREMGTGIVTLRVDNGILLLNLAAEILFPSGSTDLTDSGHAVLGKVADGLGKIPYQVVVAGYTDNIPIGETLAARYPSNWELAGARSARVVRDLEDYGIPSRRMVAVSFGENNPVAPNDTPEGREKNRRIEFRVIPIITRQ